MAKIPPVVVDAGEGDLDEKLSDLELNEKDPLAPDSAEPGDPLTEKTEQTTAPDPSSKELPLPPLPDSNSNQATN